MAPLPAPAEKPSHRVSDSQSHAKVRPPTQVAVFCAALWPNLQPALTGDALARPVRDRRELARSATEPAPGSISRHRRRPALPLPRPPPPDKRPHPLAMLAMPPLSLPRGTEAATIPSAPSTRSRRPAAPRTLAKPPIVSSVHVCFGGAQPRGAARSFDKRKWGSTGSPHIGQSEWFSSPPWQIPLFCRGKRGPT